MPLWLILIVVGAVLAIIGFGGVGVIVLIVGAVLTLVGRAGGGTRV